MGQVFESGEDNRDGISTEGEGRGSEGTGRELVLAVVIAWRPRPPGAKP
jgi:hypothetical protein